MIRSLVIALPAVALGACMDAGEEATGEVEQHSSWGNSAWYGLGDNTGATSADIGPDTGMSCFLAGIAGNISSSYGAPEPPGSLYTVAKTGVIRSGGRWYIEAQTGSGIEQLASEAMCLNVIAGRTGVYGWSGGNATLIGPVTAHRQCFLTEVRNFDMYYTDAELAAAGDSLRVWNDGFNWYIGGSGHAQGSASCIDVTAVVGTYTVGSGSGPLAYNDLMPGTQCFLTGIQGSFRNNSYSDGIYINYDPGLHQWSMSSSAGKRGWATCVK